MKKLSKKQKALAFAFDEWMLDYLTNPEKFNREFENVEAYYEGDGKKPSSYGVNCAAYLSKLLKAAK